MRRKEGRLKDLLMFLCKIFKNGALLQTRENNIKDYSILQSKEA